MESVEKVVEALKDAAEEILKIDTVKEVLGDKRVIVVVKAEGVNTRVMAPVIQKKRQRRLSSEFVQQVKDARKTLKGNRDAFYLFTLLISLHDELKKVKVEKLDGISRNVIMPAMTMVGADLTKLQLSEVG